MKSRSNTSTARPLPLTSLRRRKRRIARQSRRRNRRK